MLICLYCIELYVATAVCVQEKTEEEKDREAEALQEMKVSDRVGTHSAGCWYSCVSPLT